MIASNRVGTGRPEERVALEPGAGADQARRAARAWIDTNVPAAWLAAARSGDVSELRRARPLQAYERWYPALVGSGLVVPTWPSDCGGLGLDRAAARGVDDEINAAGLVRLNVLGIGLAGPTIVEWGTPEQRERFLAPTAANELRWCQLFSEPGAGSDLAGLATRAVLDGDTWVITGQKVWTSFARDADIGMLIARTDPTVAKHEGLTYFALDLRRPGVVIRPLVQMTGDTEFNEVFLDNVRVPDRDRIGPVGAGWRVAGTTLMNERVAISGSGGGFRERIGGRSIERLLESAARPSGGAARTSDPRWRQRLARLWIESRVVRWTNQRGKDRRQVGQTGPDGSLGKLLQAEHNRRLQEAAVDLLGSFATAREIDDVDTMSVWYGFLRSRANTIEGGTSEIQRNIIGERLLDLPREPSVDRGVAWNEVPRSG